MSAGRIKDKPDILTNVIMSEKKLKGQVVAPKFVEGYFQKKDGVICAFFVPSFVLEESSFSQKTTEDPYHRGFKKLVEIGDGSSAPPRLHRNTVKHVILELSCP